MTKVSRGLAVTAGAAALLFLAPITNADPPPPCEDRPLEQQQQCNQDAGAGIAKQVIDDVEQGARQGQQVQDAVDPNTGKPSPGRPMRMLLNGVETCWPLGVPLPPGARIAPVPGDLTGRC